MLVRVDDLLDLAGLCWLAEQEAKQQHLTLTSNNTN